MHRFLPLAAALVLAGGLTAPAAEPIKVSVEEMRRIAIAYQDFSDANGRPPSVAEQLAPHLNYDARLLGALQRGDVVFFYNEPITKACAAAGASLTMLAHEKDAPTKGGLIVMFDGSVRKVSADEFKKVEVPKK